MDTEAIKAELDSLELVIRRGYGELTELGFKTAALTLVHRMRRMVEGKPAVDEKVLVWGMKMAEELGYIQEVT